MLFAKDSKHYQFPGEQFTGVKKGTEIILIHPPIAPDVMAFLEKMVTAFGWSLDRCDHVIFTSEREVYYNALWKDQSLKLVLSFGVSPSLLGINITPISYHMIYLGTFYLYQSDALEKIAASKELKSRIWNALKEFKLTPE